MNFRIFLVFCLGISLISACEKEETTPDFTPPDSSYGLVYSKIFASSCSTSNCHGGGVYPDLQSDSTYQTILSSNVVNFEASQAGLHLVQASNVDNSFLYQKLIYEDSPFQFGSPMPLGGLTITDNQIEFIRQWIAAGAPETGHVADQSLLE